MRDGLRPRRADEQQVGAQRSLEVLEPIVEGAIQIALRHVVLRARLQLTGLHRCGPLGVRGEHVRIRDVDVLRSFEVDEVAQRPFAEPEQCELHLGRVSLGAVREVGAAHVRRRADRRQDVVDERPVQHLLRGDLEERPPPALDGFELRRRQTGADVRSQAEGGVEVLAHRHVLDLGRLAQQVRQLLAMLDHDLRPRHRARSVGACSTPGTLDRDHVAGAPRAI